MPVMDGYAASIKIREFEQEFNLRRIPIVAITAHVLEELKQKSLASGMDAHLGKPIKLHLLEQTLHELTQQTKFNPTA